MLSPGRLRTHAGSVVRELIDTKWCGVTVNVRAEITFLGDLADLMTLVCVLLLCVTATNAAWLGVASRSPPRAPPPRRAAAITASDLRADVIVVGLSLIHI